MKRTVFIISLFLMTALQVLYAQSFYKSLEPGKNQMAVYVGAYDWGPCVNKIVVHTEKPLQAESLKLSDFEVERRLYHSDTGLTKSSGELTLTEVFCSDSKGNPVSGESSYFTILTDVYPEAENSSPFTGFVSSGSGMFEKLYSYRVTNDELDLKITNVQGFVSEEAARFTLGAYDYKSDGLAQSGEDKGSKKVEFTLNYMYYIPELPGGRASPDKKLPLILWFHSIGESGSNPYQVLFGIKTTALAGEKIQKYFENGAAVLAPQCPTGWLETVDEDNLGIRYWAPVDIDGSVKKVTNPIKKFFNGFTGIKEEEKEADGEQKPFAAVSFYTEPVTQMLMSFLEMHPEIDRRRIYVGGCSAGGYMTMNMMIQHPELFAAAFPTCEYYLDSKISKEQIRELSKKPLWFTYAENDETVKPKNTSIPTIRRLREAGAKNLKVTVFPNVTDTSGTVLKNRRAKEGDRDYGLLYEYDGHSSWIYVLNDECRDENLSLYEWLNSFAN